MDPRYLTTDVLTMLAEVRSGNVEAIPILCDALMDAGAEEEAEFLRAKLEMCHRCTESSYLSCGVNAAVIWYATAIVFVNIGFRDTEKEGYFSWNFFADAVRPYAEAAYRRYREQQK